MKKKKKKKWLKFRHRVVRNIAFIILAPYCKLKYHFKVTRFKEQEKRPYLVLFNHQTAFDQFFVGMAFKGPVYYVASEDIFSKGFLSTLIRYLVAPIPIKKQTTDVRAVLDCIKVSREGGTIAMAPEGNRTFSGRTGHINPAIAPLARKLGIPILLYRLEGGYGVQPRWADTVRRGRMHGYVSKVLDPEDVAKISDEELCELINKELYVDECNSDAKFYNKKNAEYLERVFYYCPYCGMTEFESHRDTLTCKKCKRQVRYLPNKEFCGVGFDFPYRYVSDWYDAQCDFMNSLNPDEYTDKPIREDVASYSEVVVYKKKEHISDDAKISLYGDRITVKEEDGKETVFRFNEISAVTVLGRNKLNIYSDKRIFQLKSGKRFNALLFVNAFYRYKNIMEENSDGKFLGL